MSHKKQLGRNVQQTRFALIEANLYLDTHPNCQEGLAYFRKQQQLYNKAVAEYEAAYGPLRAFEQTEDSYWNWIDNPWPWETEE